MAYPNNITSLHIELTDKCQASCPMCARNINGGPERDFVGKNEITLNNFKEWFPIDWLKNLNNFYACGNYGDPILAKDCLEIFEYVRLINPTTRLSIHTNGSARNIDWWQRLAKVLGNNQEVVFGIDGFSESHQLYRRGTNWHKIIENATNFINNGGIATIDCLVFKHNQLELETFKKTMIDYGFKSVNFKSTQRFYDMEKFPVLDKNLKHEYDLLPPTISPYKKTSNIKLEEIAKNIEIWNNIVKNSTINPKCVNENTVYVDARGNVSPCCWVGSDIVEQPLQETFIIQKLRNDLVNDTKSKFYDIKNLTNSDIQNLTKDNMFYNLNEKWIGNSKASICVKNCGVIK